MHMVAETVDNHRPSPPIKYILNPRLIPRELSNLSRGETENLQAFP